VGFSMSDFSRITVVGADGMVGGTLASALDANRVLHGPGRGLPHEVAARDSGSVVAGSVVVFNAQGLRQAGTLTLEEFRATHVDATKRLVAQMSPGATLVHISSAAVLGRPASCVKGRGQPEPDSFPMPDYAKIKHEAERVAIEEGMRHGLAIVVLRPAIVCASPLDGMLLSLVEWLRRGLLLQLLPLRTRHHFCSGELLSAVARSVAERSWPSDQPTLFTVADPFTISNRDLTLALIQRWGYPSGLLPLPACDASRALESMSGIPGIGPRMASMGRTLGVIGLNVEYQVDETFDELGLNRVEFGRAQTFERVLDEEARLDVRPCPKHVLVVGATGGIGRALVDELASHGKRVSVVGRSPVPGFAGWQRTADVVHADWAGLFAEIDAHAPVDAVVFVAGTGALGPAACVPDTTAHEIMELNFWSVARLATAAAERWAAQRRCGGFVAVLSLAALRGMPFEAHYGASKAATARFLQALQFEYPRSIHLNGVYPGAIATPFRSRIPHFGVPPADTARDGDPPEKTAKAIMALLEGRPGSRTVGTKARAIAILDRISPRIYDRLVENRMATFLHNRIYPSQH
jgi:NAD(P)-dependent dehydrogenase (short-subunit alcohol dehydrogenase family)